METIIQPSTSVAPSFKMLTEHNITYFVCEPLRAAGFRNAFSTRLGGVSRLPDESLNLGYFSGDDPENVLENRRRFLHALNADSWPIVTGKQVHSADLRVVKSECETLKPSSNCDGVVAKHQGILAGVFTADCTPVLIGDPVTGAFAAVHAGWRGTVARIVEKAVNAMRKEFKSDPANCIAAIGPAAGACCYEIGQDVINKFTVEFNYAEQLFINHRGDKANLDVVTANVRQLIDSGLVVENIYKSDLCTMCRVDMFFSYRREKSKGAVGRLLSVIGRQ
jgi:YfiH family protein